MDTVENLMQLNYFELFGLPEVMALDLQLLDQQYFKLQARYHPDVDATPEHAQLFSHLNEAYKTLKSPVSRLEYILQLHQLHYNEHESLSPEFMQYLMDFERAEEVQQAIDILLQQSDEALGSGDLPQLVQNYHQIKYLLRTLDNLNGRIV